MLPEGGSSSLCYFTFYSPCLCVCKAVLNSLLRVYPAMWVTMLMFTAVQVSVIPCSNEFHRFSTTYCLEKCNLLLLDLWLFPISVETPFLLRWVRVNRFWSTFSLCCLFSCIFWSCSFLVTIFCKHSQSFQSVYHSYCTFFWWIFLRWANQKWKKYSRWGRIIDIHNK